MNEIEKVEKLREKVNVSYADAKRALAQSNWDILDAVILLEQEGIVFESEPKTSHYTSKAETSNEAKSELPPHKGESFYEMLGRLGRWLGKIINIGNTNYFAVEKNGEDVFAIPVTVFVLLAVFCFWAVIPLLIVGLFFGLRYSLRGPNLEKNSINTAIHKATDVAAEIKEEFKNSTNKNEHKDEK